MNDYNSWLDNNMYDFNYFGGLQVSNNICHPILYIIYIRNLTGLRHFPISNIEILTYQTFIYR